MAEICLWSKNIFEEKDEPMQLEAVQEVAQDDDRYADFVADSDDDNFSSDDDDDEEAAATALEPPQKRAK